MHLAELNIARLLAPTDDPKVAEFMANLDRINGLGKRMPGFVWIMEGSDGAGNTETKLDGDPQFVSNLTVWEDFESLSTFVHQTLHAKFMARKAEWFHVAEKPQFVMWWIEEGHIPTLEEGLERLAYLQSNGNSDHAFGWSWVKKRRKQSIVLEARCTSRKHDGYECLVIGSGLKLEEIRRFDDRDLIGEMDDLNFDLRDAKLAGTPVGVSVQFRAGVCDSAQIYLMNYDHTKTHSWNDWSEADQLMQAKQLRSLLQQEGIVFEFCDFEPRSGDTYARIRFDVPARCHGIAS